jgi:NTE family protein
VQPASLERLAAIAGLASSELADVTARMTAESVPRGTVVFRRGDPGDGMYLVLEGQVGLEIDGVTVGLCAPGEWFGELALFTAGPRTADARVAVDAVLVRVDRASWMALATRSPRLLASLCERLSRQLRASAENRRRSRTVIACPETPALLASVRRQFPGQAVRVVDAAGEELERVLAELTAPDLLVLVTNGDAAGMADRALARADATSWTITPGYGGRAVDHVRGVTADDAIDRVARRLAGRTIGLALGAGGAYGFAHIGLVQVLAEHGIPVDYVAGTSMGAIIGACVAAGIDGDRMQRFAENAATRFGSIVLRDVDLQARSLLTGRAVMTLLGELAELRTATFESVCIPFVAVATDIGTGEEIVIGAGPLLDGVQPSFAMPGIFPPCVRDGRALVDGAMVNPVPVDRVRALGADIVVALQPIPPLRPEPLDPVSGLFGRMRRLAGLLPVTGVRDTLASLEVSVRSFQAVWRQLGIEAAAGADVVVAPELERYFFLQFGAAAEIVTEGRRAAEAAVGRVLERVSDRRS